MPQSANYEPDEATITAEAAKIRERRIRAAPDPPRFRRAKHTRQRRMGVGKGQQLIISGIMAPPTEIVLRFNRPVNVFVAPEHAIYLRVASR